MKPVSNIECLVSFQRPTQVVDCRTVSLPKNTTEAELIDAVRAALRNQHEVYGCPITNIRVRSKYHRRLDWVVRPELLEQKRKMI